MTAVAATLKNTATSFYHHLPAKMGNQVGFSFLASFCVQAMISAADDVETWTNPLLAGATGAMLAIISGATEPVLVYCGLGKTSAAFWVTKCVVSIAATAVIAPAFASLFGVALKVSVLSTAIFAILQLTRRAWNQGLNANFTNSPIAFLACLDFDLGNLPQLGSIA